MTKSSNKKMGNDFEAELCGILFEHGFWVHDLAQNASGQPADIIAVRNGRAYLIDCKVCSGGKFDLQRVEENQESAMKLWTDCRNGMGWFAFKVGEHIQMLPHPAVQALRVAQSSITNGRIMSYGTGLGYWMEHIA